MILCEITHSVIIDVKKKHFAKSSFQKLMGKNEITISYLAIKVLKVGRKT